MQETINKKETKRMKKEENDVGKIDKYNSYKTNTTDWTIGVLGFDSPRGLGMFLLTTASRTVLGPTQPLI
jgi:hypothetical protein